MNKTKLLYLYVDEIGRGISDQELIFTNDYEVSFLNKELVLKTKVNNLKKYWNTHDDSLKNIYNMNLFVGENGAGKSTVLDLLAKNNIARRGMSFKKCIEPFSNPSKKRWFALYEINPKDRKFAIEGEGFNFINNLSWENFNHKSQKLIHGVIVQHDENKNKFIIDDALNENNTNSKSLEFIYLPSRKTNSWFGSVYANRHDEADYTFARKEVGAASYCNLYTFIQQTNDYKFMKELFSAQNIECVLKIKTHKFIQDIIVSKENQFLYQNCVNATHFLENAYYCMEEKIIESEKNVRVKTFAIAFLETCAYLLHRKFSEKHSGERFLESLAFEVSEVYFKTNTYYEIKNYLFNVLKIIGKYAKKFGEKIDSKNTLIKDIVIAIEQLCDEDLEEVIEISFPIKGYKMKYYNLLSLIDKAKEEPYFSSDIIDSIEVNFRNLSTGELDFIDLFSRLYSMKSNNDFSGCSVIVLDEPDASFHPEWSRKFVSMLSVFLSEEVFKDRMFQVLIASHSPFMISDFPKEHISCFVMNRSEDGTISRNIVRGKFGLASNLYDVVKEDFFLKMPIGSYAGDYINKIIEEISEIQKENTKNSKDRYEEKNINLMDKVNDVKSKIEIIDDYVIKSKLEMMIDSFVSEHMTLEYKIKRAQEKLDKLKEERNHLR